MRKHSLLITMILMLAFSSVYAGDLNTSTNKKHRFGFGVATTVFDNAKGMNNFGENNPKRFGVLGGSVYEDLELSSSSFYSLYFEYQYHLLDYGYLSTRLKLNDRSLRYYYTIDAKSDGYAQRVLMPVRLTDLEVPIMANLKLPITQNLNWILSLGAGVSFNIFDNGANKNSPIVINFQPIRTTSIHFELERKVNYFINFGTGFDFTVKKHKLQSFISYTIYPSEMYQLHYFNTDPTAGNNLNGNKFSQNNLEVGISFFL